MLARSADEVSLCDPADQRRAVSFRWIERRFPAVAPDMTLCRGPRYDARLRSPADVLPVGSR